ASKGGVLARHADRQNDRSVVPQALLYRSVDELRPRAQQLQLIRMLQKTQYAITDEANRGLKPSNQQSDRLRQQLGLAELVSRLFGADEFAEDIVAEMPAPV